MRHYCLSKFLHFFILFCISFQAFCQFGEKQIIDDGNVDEELRLTVDINNDGYDDLIMFRRDKKESGYAGSHILRLNDGNNNFEEEFLVKYDENEWREIVPVDIDIDNDNDQDLVIRNDLNQLTWLINNNNSFSWKFRIDNDYYGSFQFGDINNDGFPDYIKEEDTGGKRKYFSFLNDGSGKFETKKDLGACRI